MTVTVPGTLGPVMLDGHTLGRVMDQQRDVTLDESRAVVQMARGNRREALSYQGAGNPLIGGKYRVTLRYTNIGPHLDLIECIFQTPGPHSLVIWHRIHRAYAGDGARVAFALDRAPLIVTPASYAGFPALFPEGIKARLGLEAGIGMNTDGSFDTEYTVQQKTQGEYDAGTPIGVQAWFVPEVMAFKVGTAPVAGETFYVRFVPILQVFNDPTVTKSYPAATPRREPRDLVLLEQ